MTETERDDREPTPCPRCGELCSYDGWGLVHTTGLGIGSCPRCLHGIAWVDWESGEAYTSSCQLTLHHTGLHMSEDGEWDD